MTRPHCKPHSHTPTGGPYHLDSWLGILTWTFVIPLQDDFLSSVFTTLPLKHPFIKCPTLGSPEADGEISTEDMTVLQAYDDSIQGVLYKAIESPVSFQPLGLGAVLCIAGCTFHRVPGCDEKRQYLLVTATAYHPEFLNID